MQIKKINGRTWPAICQALVLPVLLSPQVDAVEFYTSGIEGTFDSKFSVGSSWRMEKPSDQLTQGIEGAETNSQNNNDGNLNFDEGDAFSRVFKGTHDLKLSYNGVGAFVRGKYWYDSALEHGDKHEDSGSGFDDDQFNSLAKSSGSEILDAFIYWETDLLNTPADLRLGKQVVSWGESTFISGGVNQINPLDLSAFRRPGAEIKEGLIPVNMAYASLILTDAISTEAFYLLDFKETVVDGCGTYFSTNDYMPEGCGPVQTAAGEIERSDDVRPDADGQFGVAFRYFSEALDTEFGLYAMSVHSRLPVVGAYKAGFNETDALTDTSTLEYASLSSAKNAAGQGVVAAYNQVTGGSITDYQSLAVAAMGGDPVATQLLTQYDAEVTVGAMSGLTAQGAPGIDGMDYVVDYPEDQKLVGVSFSTNMRDVAVSGEVTHKLDVPVQINASRLLGAALQADALYAYVYNAAGGSNNPQADAIARAAVKQEHTSFGLDVLDNQDGSYMSGYKTFDVTQAQISAIKPIDQMLGANRIDLVVEAGYIYVHDFNSDIEFSGNGEFKDTVTESSWGVRGKIIPKFNNVYSGVNLSPVISFGQDGRGVSPQPGGNFIEGQRTLGISLNADYLNAYTASISYTEYSGGETNSLADRDFASISLSAQF